MDRRYRGRMTTENRPTYRYRVVLDLETTAPSLLLSDCDTWSRDLFDHSVRCKNAMVSVVTNEPPPGAWREAMVRKSGERGKA